MILVAVSQRVESHWERHEQRDTLDQRLVALILAAGGLPVPVPNAPDALDAWLTAVAPTALLLSGGNDIGSCPSRDATETRLLDHARTQILPVLGLCRGMQMLGVYSGARLVPVADHVACRHALGGELEGEVNSYHNQALDSCPGGWRVLAHAADGVIEAMAHKVLPWEAWMWHPEREPRFADGDIKRLRELFTR